jgi:hypothetical protein
MRMRRPTVRLPGQGVWYYNLRVGRDRHQVEREVRAILSTRPALAGFSEAIGYPLPEIAGYWKLRDTSTPGRANVAAYVRIDFPVRGIEWTDCEETWTRPKHGGRHWARSILSFRMARVPAIVGHQPPRFTDNVTAAQLEGIRKMAALMSPEPRVKKVTKAARKKARQRPRLALADFNRRASEPGPGPRTLARLIGGRVVPRRRIDALVYRGQVRVLWFRRPTKVAGVQLRSDHSNALYVRLWIPRRWLTLN